MKKVLLGALVVLTGAASATSIRNVKLELKTSPTRHISGSTTYIQVLADGLVQGTTCAAKISPLGCQSVELDHLSNREMRQINRLIRQAEKGEIKSPDLGRFHCLAIPFRSSRYTANNGTVLLRSGSYPCGHTTENVSDAARELVEILDGYSRDYSNTRVGDSELMEEVG